MIDSGAPNEALDKLPYGTRVRVTFEGVLRGRLAVDNDGVHRLIGRSDTVEAIGPPEPEWWPPQLGDVALLGGLAWERHALYWRRDGCEPKSDKHFRDATLVTLIARAGLPYPLGSRA